MTYGMQTQFINLEMENNAKYRTKLAVPWQQPRGEDFGECQRKA